MRLIKILRLSTRDYVHEWQMSSCFILALAAVLGPMLVLFGLKFGIIGGMLDQLIEDPANREIRPVSSGSYDRAWLAEFRKRDDVAFLVPRTRSIAATLQLKSDNARRIINTEMISSDDSDPLLQRSQAKPNGLSSIVLSHSAANKLKVKAGDTIDGSLVRRYRGNKDRVHIKLKVASIAPSSAFSRDGAFADLRLVEALEDFRDGHAVAALGWKGEPASEDRSYPSFRLYASSIYDVAALKKILAEAGIEVRTKAADIELVMKMDNNLSTVFWSIAIIGLIGFSLSLGASLWANVDRKRKELSVLRLVGFRTGDIVWFPVIQAFYTALFGWGLAIGIFWGAALTINDMLSSQLGEGQQVCILLPEHYAMALAVTLFSSIVAAILSGMRSARIEPSEGLREV